MLKIQNLIGVIKIHFVQQKSALKKKKNQLRVFVKLLGGENDYILFLQCQKEKHDI